MAGEPAPSGQPAAEAAGKPRAVFELVFVLALAIGTAAMAWQAISLPIFAADGTVGPGFFPIPLTLILLAGLALYAVSLIRRLHTFAPREGDTAVFDRPQLIAIGLVVVVTLIGGLIGLYAAVALILVVGLFLVDRLTIRESLLFAIGALIVFYLTFDLWLGQNIGLDAIRWL